MTIETERDARLTIMRIYLPPPPFWRPLKRRQWRRLWRLLEETLTAPRVSWAEVEGQFIEGTLKPWRACLLERQGIIERGGEQPQNPPPLPTTQREIPKPPERKGQVP